MSNASRLASIVVGVDQRHLSTQVRRLFRIAISSSLVSASELEKQKQISSQFGASILHVQFLDNSSANKQRRCVSNIDLKHLRVELEVFKETRRAIERLFRAIADVGAPAR